MKLISNSFCSVALFLVSACALATPKPVFDLGVEPRATRSGERADNDKEQRAIAIFAGGCFWCMEPPFDETEGVLETISGYIGGHVENPTYQQVSAGTTGHYEAVKIVYDPGVVSYEQLLPIFWRNVDPLDSKGQFCDKGQQYLSAIFPLNQQQKQAAQRSLQHLRADAQLPGSVATRIIPASEFYAAEQYHQDYYQKNPLRYRYYRGRCGRDERLEALWGKPGIKQ